MGCFTCISLHIGKKTRIFLQFFTNKENHTEMQSNAVKCGLIVNLTAVFTYVVPQLQCVRSICIRETKGSPGRIHRSVQTFIAVQGLFSTMQSQVLILVYWFKLTRIACVISYLLVFAGPSGQANKPANIFS